MSHEPLPESRILGCKDLVGFLRRDAHSLHRAGCQTFTDLPKRPEETRKAGEAVGAKLVAFYLTMGQYDAVVISDAPDDQTVAKLALAAAGRGNVRTEVLRAFIEDEAKGIEAEL